MPFVRASHLSCLTSYGAPYDVRVVLVMPKNPQNIGSVLRAAGNFSVPLVTLVAPRCPDVNEDTIQNVACGSPTRLETVSTLEEALVDSTVSLAFSRRKGKGRPALPSLSAFLQGDDGWMGRGEGSEGGEERGEAMALVFGREESGLEAEEIMLCSHTVEIPSDPAFPSLNLSHAVAVVLSQLYAAAAERREKETRQDRTGREALATHAELNALYMRVTGMLERKGLDVSESRGGGDVGNHGRRVRAPGHLKSVLLKGRLTKAECRSLFGLVKELEAAM